MNFLEYIKRLEGVLTRIGNEQRGNIKAAGNVVANTLARGGIVHTFGTGHSHIIAEDAFFRAGGIAAVNPILDERFLFLKGALESTRSERQPGIARKLIENENVGPADVAIIISNSGRNAAPVEMALEMQSRGVSVIAITSLEQSRASTSRHTSGKRLFGIADVVIDNCVPPGDALIKIDGIESMTGASSTVAGSAIIHSIMIEALSELARRGVSPPVLPSANMENTSADTLRDILRPFEGRIRYLDLDTEID
ncbi:MAG: SIS domain-containing protein [Pyrinomonadaceae bacterium]